MSTYNGEKYLSEQLDSLIAQTHANWTLLIRDDGSTDTTLSIIKQYSIKDLRIIFFQDNLGNLHVAKSFSVLMGEALKRNEPYVFFCDQDDIWLPHKIEATIKKINELELNTNSTPILVHTDLRVVDNTLNTLHASYLRFEHLTRNPNNPLKTLLINNYVTGCTIGMNRSLLKLTTPIPDDAYMHDWWCALCAATNGKIGFITEPTILYRQHAHNSIGSSGFYGKIKELKQLRTSITKRRRNLKICFNQASCLLAKTDRQNKHYNFIAKFVAIYQKKHILRYTPSIKLHLQPASRIRGVVFWVFLGWA